MLSMSVVFTMLRMLLDPRTQRIIDLNENPVLQKQLSKNGLNYIRDNFSWSAFVEQLNVLMTE